MTLIPGDPASYDSAGKVLTRRLDIANTLRDAADVREFLKLALEESDDQHLADSVAVADRALKRIRGGQG